ncbi:hypothetical protein MUK42_13608 [Musa troglodytarum]|uniref:C3H1-type domain-containing protein n=1 Tax=Musa troglodytarum TaxID=320322 RepID=A0A9E7I6I7_9LILI|nr:hypothetical protein MUK42_13608 [Musa troglodytarum]
MEPLPKRLRMEPADTSGSGRIPAIRRRGRWPAGKYTYLFLSSFVWRICLGPVLPVSAAPASAMQQKADIAVGNPRIATSGYKTTLCSCFDTAEGCQFGNFCHFAHREGDTPPQKEALCQNSFWKQWRLLQFLFNSFGNFLKL